MSSSQKFFLSSDSVEKMGDELAILLDLLKSFKKAGRLATLTLSPKGSKTTKVKLEVELEDASLSSPPTTTASAPSTSLPSPPGCQAAGVRLRPRRSAAKRAKANARAAQHRAFQALPFPGGDYGAALGPPDPSPPQPRRPLQLHPSPKDENRRQETGRLATSPPSLSWMGTKIHHLLHQLPLFSHHNPHHQ